MAKTQKAKSNKGARNDNRKNGKAEKKHPGRKGHGSRRTPLDEGMKVLLGGGMLAKWSKHDFNEKLVMKAKNRKKNNSLDNDD